MTKILVKKSVPKDVLVKKSVPKDVLVKEVQPQLMQQPGKGKSFMDFARVAFGQRRKNPTSEYDVSRPGVSPLARLAGFAGMAGKGLAAVQTANQVAQQAQAGNPLGAALTAGYAFEANDPTGRMISDAADPTLSHAPVKHKLDKTPPAKFSVDAALDPQNNHAKGPVGPPIDRNSFLGSRYNPDAGKAPLIPGRERRQPSTYPQQQLSTTTAFNNLGAGHPTGVPIQAQRPSPVVPNTSVPNVTAMPVSQMQPPGYPPNQIQSIPLPHQVPPAPPVKTLEQHNAVLMQPQPMQPQPMQPQPMQPQPVQQMAQQPMGQTRLDQFPQAPGQENVSMLQGNGTPVVAPGQENLHMLTDENKQAKAEFFASTLMEKLGADTVYKMNPHQVAMVSAYTFLKLS